MNLSEDIFCWYLHFLLLLGHNFKNTIIMKKNVLIIVSILTISVISIYGNMGNNDLSDLALANVEALANKVPIGAEGNCEYKNGEWCSFVVASPTGNHIETYPNSRVLP